MSFFGDSPAYNHHCYHRPGLRILVYINGGRLDYAVAPKLKVIVATAGGY